MIREPVLDVICSLYPNIHPLLWLNPHLASVSIPERGTTSLVIDDLCQICPLALSNVLSIATMYGSTSLSFTNRFPIVDILSLMSTDIVESLLSNVLLSGRLVNPHAFNTFLLYG